MASPGTISFHAAPAQFCAFNLILAPIQQPLTTSTYEVRNLTGDVLRYLCNAVPSTSYRHKGDGWTRVSVPLRDEKQLTAHLKDFHEWAYRKA